MSEYQCYEFVALDRPLTSDEMEELRSISTRAEISPTRFWNEYHWGDLRADPKKLLTRYFDAFLYFANWASHRFMLRLPTSRVDVRLGLRSPNAALRALIEFLCIDPDLVAAAAERSPDEIIDENALRKWIKSLPVRDKDRWLIAAAGDSDVSIGSDLIAAFRRAHPAPRTSLRTVSALLARAEELRIVREAAKTAQAAKDQRRVEAKRKKCLVALAKQGNKARHASKRSSKSASTTTP